MIKNFNLTIICKKNYVKILIFIYLFLFQIYLIKIDIAKIRTNSQELFLIIIFIVFIIFSHKKSLKKIIKNKILLSFCLLTIFGTCVALPTFFDKIDNYNDAFNHIYFLRHLRYSVFAILTTLLFFAILTTRDEQKKGFVALGLGAIMFSIFSLIINLLGLGRVDDFRLKGFLDSAVYLAYYISPFLIFFGILFFENLFSKKTWKKLIFDFFCFFFLGLFLIFTKSIGSLISVFTVFSIYFFSKFYKKLFIKQKTKIFLFLVFCLFSCLLLSMVFKMKIMPFLENETSSLGERFEIWTTSFYILRNKFHFFFGVGLGQFQHFYFWNIGNIFPDGPMSYVVLQPHNIFLLFWFQYGIFGLLFLFFVFKRIFILFILLFKNKISQKNFVFVYMLLYFLIHGLIDVPIFKNDLLTLFLILLTLVFFDFEKKSKPREYLSS